MKARRHAKILELINSRPIDTQDDIKELRLVKTLTSDGKYHYTAHTEHPKSEMSDKFLLIFSESVREIDSAGNMLVIKCFTGMANAVCAALDTLHWSGVVGTLAGDDTIFMVMRDEQNAHELVSQLRRMMA